MSTFGKNQLWRASALRGPGVLFVNYRRALSGGGGCSAECGNETRTGDITSAVSGVPSAQCREESRSGYLTQPVSGAHVWAKWLVHRRRCHGCTITTLGTAGLKDHQEPCLHFWDSIGCNAN